MLLRLIISILNCDFQENLPFITQLELLSPGCTLADKTIYGLFSNSIDQVYTPLHYLQSL